ncbi:MAG: hypothetical protein WDO74_31725 [Pseudomonadota bacterium]
MRLKLPTTLRTADRARVQTVATELLYWCKLNTRPSRRLPGILPAGGGSSGGLKLFEPLMQRASLALDAGMRQGVRAGEDDAGRGIVVTGIVAEVTSPFGHKVELDVPGIFGAAPKMRLPDKQGVFG